MSRRLAAKGAFATVTTDANELVAEIHDPMPLVLARGDCVRWLGEEENPRGLTRPFPARTDADMADFNAGQEARER